MVFKIRLVSPWEKTDIQIGNFNFSIHYSVDEADALLCEWAPHDELFTFSKPKAWYCCEPIHGPQFAKKEWIHYRNRLNSSERFYHSHPDLEYRVPHITIKDTSGVYYFADKPIQKKSKAIAVVSNTGGSPWRRTKQMMTRGLFITHSSVDLFGKKEVWKSFRQKWFSYPNVPANYCGEIPGSWTAQTRYALMSQYKAVVCLENTIEPYYFTEKFVSAVQANCIPIYHAHPTVRDTILQGAKWVDPVDFDFDPNATLAFALKEELQEYITLNQVWLYQKAIPETSFRSVFHRIATILARNATK